MLKGYYLQNKASGGGEKGCLPRLVQNVLREQGKEACWVLFGRGCGWGEGSKGRAVCGLKLLLLPKDGALGLSYQLSLK